METHYTPEFNAAMPDEPYSGIDEILPDSSGEVELFNLQGMKVSDKVTPGIYIRKTGHGIEKILVR